MKQYPRLMQNPSGLIKQQSKKPLCWSTPCVIPPFPSGYITYDIIVGFVYGLHMFWICFKWTPTEPRLAWQFYVVLLLTKPCVAFHRACEIQECDPPPPTHTHRHTEPHQWLTSSSVLSVGLSAFPDTCSHAGFYWESVVSTCEGAIGMCVFVPPLCELSPHIISFFTVVFLVPQLFGHSTKWKENADEVWIRVIIRKSVFVECSYLN